MTQNAGDAGGDVCRPGCAPTPVRPAWIDQLAHDLRGPLSPVVAGITLLGSGRLNPDQQTDLLATMQRQIETLMQLIDDTAELLIQRGCTLAPLDMANLLDMAMGRMSRRFAAAGVTVEPRLPDVPIAIHGEVRSFVRLLAYLALRTAEIAGNGNHVVASVEKTDGTRVRLTLVPRIAVAEAADSFATLVNKLSAPSPTHVADAMLREILVRHDADVAMLAGSTPGIVLSIAAAPILPGG